MDILPDFETLTREGLEEHIQFQQYLRSMLPPSAETDEWYRDLEERTRATWALWHPEETAVARSGSRSGPPK